MQRPDLQRLEHIRDYCSEIEQTISRFGDSFEVFDMDADFQRSVSFCILQIGELCNGLSKEFQAETSDRTPWKLIIWMRNLVAHHYGSMSRDVIWETVKSDIPALKAFCEEQMESGK